MVEKLQKEKNKGSFLGFIRHDVALGSAGFVAGVYTALIYPFAMWHTRGPGEEGLEIIKWVYRVLMTPLEVRGKHN